MKKILKFIFVVFVLVSSITPFAKANKSTGQLPEPFLVIPQPQNVELIKGAGIKYGELSMLKLTKNINRPIMGDILSELIIGEKSINKGILTLELGTGGFLPKSNEGYILTISGGNAKIESQGEAGLFYGCQTLEQLLEDAHDFGKMIPACKITDFPALEYRAVHFDLKHHLDHMNYYYQSVNRLARYKINAIIVEFEDKLRYQRQPLVGAPQAISIEEMAALTKYARDRHIEITPLVQGLGHASFILKHEEYKHLRELKNNNWAFCPLNEGTYQVLFDMYRDAIEATPGSRYLHIGGDEIGNIGLCPRCKPTADKNGMLSLNLYWLKRVCEFAKENGRIPIFWDDMPLKEAGVYKTTYKKDISLDQATEVWKIGAKKMNDAISEFPKNCIYMRWNYSAGTQPGNIMALDWYKNHGLKVIIATATQTANALLPLDNRTSTMDFSGPAAIKSFIQIAKEKNVMGMLCTAWDDASPHFETLWHGFIASAEYSWSPYKRSLSDFDLAWMQKEFATSIPDYYYLYKKLRNAASFWEMAFNRKGIRMNIENAMFNLPGYAHWLPPKKTGTPVKTDFTDVLISIPNLQSPGKWSKKYAERLKQAKEIISEYKDTKKTLKNLKENSKRNRYYWEVFIAINDFQLSAPQLLLALEQCDTNNMEQQKKGAKNVKIALQNFEITWNNLQNIYSKTRFISYPDSYVPDRYFHFASQREDLSWMIQDEELFHKMIKTWMKDSNLQ